MPLSSKSFLVTNFFSMLESWLPAIYILYLGDNYLYQSMNSLTSGSLVYGSLGLLQSPECITISMPLGTFNKS
jgi:hypothetical protein